MSRRGNCWDNAVAESFFHTLKGHIIHDRVYATRKEVTVELFEYIEIYYNRRRRHSTLGWLSPVAFEQLYYQSLEGGNFNILTRIRHSNIGYLSSVNFENAALIDCLNCPLSCGQITQGDNK